MLAGIAWHDKGLLEAALTHRSHAGENYERLEFLGDRVLNLLVAEWLMELNPAATEADLSLQHTFMVRERSLVTVAKAWGLPEHMRMGAGEKAKDSILADGVEAVLGALWLDQGLEVTREVVRRDWQVLLNVKIEKDAKTRLQEALQAEKLGLPKYDVVEETGPDHAKYFKVKVICGWGEAVGEGASKQFASVVAAEMMLEKAGK